MGEIFHEEQTNPGDTAVYIVNNILQSKQNAYFPTESVLNNIIYLAGREFTREKLSSLCEKYWKSMKQVDRCLNYDGSFNLIAARIALNYCQLAWTQFSL